MQPRTVGHYEILDKLGEGGMGVVWKARDLILGRITAIKVLPPAKSGDTARRERFIQEARTASSLNHPNIVTVHEVFTHEDEEYLVMEFVEGSTLDVLIGRQGLRVSVALEYALQMADALSAAHRAGIVHRDLKPSNVMVTDGGLVKVLDFGVAKLVDTPDAPSGDDVTRELSDTATGIVLGTVAFMSPEQAEGKPVDARSDIFSFGALFYEMLTGRRAFSAPTRTHLIAAIREDEPPAPAIPLPRDVERVMLRCLRKEPSRRWQSTMDLKLALEELRDDTQRRPAALLTKRRRIGVPIAALTVALAAALAVTLWVTDFSLRPRPDPVIVPLTTYPGSEVEPALSPNGDHVAFAWNGPEVAANYSIYVKLIGAGEPVRLTTNPRSHYQPKWSPDGKWIAFLRSQEGAYRFGVYVIPAFGGAERKVGDAAGQALAWTPDGTALMLSRPSAPDQRAGLVRLSIESGDMTPLTQPTNLQSDEGVVYSPNGRTIAFKRNLGPVGSVALLTMPAPTALVGADAFKRLKAPDDISLGLFSWTADGRDLIYSAGWNQENAALWRVPASGGGAPVRLTVAGDGALAPDVARHGDRLAFSRYLGEINIWSLELDASGRPAGVPTRAFDSSMSELCPRFSVDGTKVAFESNRSGNDEVWTCQSDGALCRQLTSFGTHAGSPSWSPDGEWIAFDGVGPAGGSVYLISANGGKPTLLEQGQLPRWSRDGKWIYYFKGSPSQIYRIPRSGGTPQLLTQQRANTVEESADGTAVYYTRSASVGRTPLHRIPISGGEPTEVIPQVAGRNFVVTQTGIWYLAPRPIQSAVTLYDLSFYDFATKSSRVVYQPERQVYAGLTTSPDGRRILFTQIDRTGNDLVLVEHFR